MVYARDHRSSNRDSQDEAPKTTGLFPSRSLSDRAKSDFRPPVPDAHVERTKKLNPRFNRSFAHIPVRNLGNPPPAFDRAQMTIQAKEDDARSSSQTNLTESQANLTKKEAKLAIQRKGTAKDAVKFLWKQPKKFHKALVLVMMSNDDGDGSFIKELAKEGEGRKLLEKMVDGTWTAWIPNAARLLNSIKWAGTLPGPVQGTVGVVLGLPLALVGGSIGGTQRYAGLLQSNVQSKLFAGSHRDWIKELMRQEFDIKFSKWKNNTGGTWSEDALRKTYKAFHLLPYGTVQTAVEGLVREGNFGGSAEEEVEPYRLDEGEQDKGSQGTINIGRFNPTTVATGALEPFTRLVGDRFP